VSGHEHRLTRLQDVMEKLGWDAVVASGEAHVAHLTGYARYYSGPSAVLVERGGRRTLLLPVSEAAVAAADVEEVAGFGVPGFGLDPDPEDALARAVADRLGDRTVAAAGTVARRMAPGVADADAVLAAIRRRKDADELERMLDAYDLCWAGQRAIAAGAAAGASEIELFSAAQSAAQEAHGAPVEFVCDALAGERTAAVCCPAAVAGRASPAPGDPVLADVSLCAAGYWGDSAESHAAGPRRDALVEILDAVASELRPGRTGGELFALMHDRITSRFPDGGFPHHGGHGLGVTAHEPPHLVPGGPATLEAGQVVALEPGVYTEAGGTRVEELYLVTPEGGVELRTAYGRSRGLAVSC
jgi:Xaa-Pro aminopeptidase